MWVCMQNVPTNTAIGSITKSSSSSDHAASRNTNHQSTGMYGFHGDVSMNAPYARVSTDEHEADREHHAEPAAPVRDPQREADAHDVEHDVAREEPERRATEQRPGRPQPVEADRTGVTAAERPERTDAPRQTDQRRVTARNVADAHLGLRPVEQRVPARMVQRDQRDEERNREHGAHEHDDPARIAPALRRANGGIHGRRRYRFRRFDHCRVRHGSAFSSRTTPGRTGD